MKRDTEVRYPGPIDAVEVPMPEDAREFHDPRHEIVKRGETLMTTAAHAKGLIECGWELVKTKGGGKA